MTPTRLNQYVSYERPVSIELFKAALEGDLALPPHPCGIVLFAHGSGSSRHSPRNRFVAETLQAHGIGTLLMDLLTASEEEITGEHLCFASTFDCWPNDWPGQQHGPCASQTCAG